MFFNKACSLYQQVLISSLHIFHNVTVKMSLETGRESHNHAGAFSAAECGCGLNYFSIDFRDVLGQNDHTRMSSYMGKRRKAGKRKYTTGLSFFLPVVFYRILWKTSSPSNLSTLRYMLKHRE